MVDRYSLRYAPTQSVPTQALRAGSKLSVPSLTGLGRLLPSGYTNDFKLHGEVLGAEGEGDQGCDS